MEVEIKLALPDADAHAKVLKVRPFLELAISERFYATQQFVSDLCTMARNESASVPCN